MSKDQVSLHRTLTLNQVILFGLAYLTPMIVYGIYGIIAQKTHGFVATAYFFALIAMFFTAYSYGQMVKAFPVSGSAYTYTRRSISSHLGFLIGWSVMLDYVFIPMAIWLIGATYLHSAFPAVPLWVWILLFILITTIINILSIQLSTNINMILMIFQFVVIAIFMILCIKDLVLGHGSGTLLSFDPIWKSDTSFSLVLAGSAVACYSFLGFDAVTTLTEETVEPQKNMPKAILLITLIGGLIFIIASYFASLAFPIYNGFKDPDSAGFEMALRIGGNLFSAIFLAGLILAQFTSGLSAQASASRLLYAMGRDGVFPKKIFGFLHPRFRTPIYSLLILGVVALLALTLDVSTSTSFINFGAFTAFTFVNLSVIGHYYVRQQKRSGMDHLRYLLVPLVGAFLNIWLLISLDRNAQILGGIWFVIGVIVLLILTRGFTRRPPELDFKEVD